jgi:hypothetical protein
MIRLACVWAAVVFALPAAALAGTVRDARIAVVFSAHRCDVTARFVLDTSQPEIVEHRLLSSGGQAPEFAVLGGLAGGVEIVGRTVRLPVSIAGSGRNEYLVRYSAALPPADPERCPLLVPSAPTDGVTRAVRIEVELPSDTRRLPGEFPAFTWSGRGGVVTIGHMPSFVRVPHVAQDAPVAWRRTLDVRRTIDFAAMATIALTTVGWIARRRRRA